MQIIKFLFVLTLAASCGACAGSRQYQTIDPSNAASAGVPPYLELRETVQVATLHFPSGTYTLNATDTKGAYYGAPAKVLEHVVGAAIPHEGGIYVRGKGNVTLRGYIYWHGGLTHVGNLSHASYTFHD